MAAIDKIYGTGRQWDELFVWLSMNRPQYCRFLYAPNMQEHSSDEMMISNFPTYADNWLLKNCPFKWVKERIKEQYRNSVI